MLCNRECVIVCCDGFFKNVFDNDVFIFIFCVLCYIVSEIVLIYMSGYICRWKVGNFCCVLDFVFKRKKYKLLKESKFLFVVVVFFDEDWVDED